MTEFRQNPGNSHELRLSVLQLTGAGTRREYLRSLNQRASEEADLKTFLPGFLIARYNLTRPDGAFRYEASSVNGLTFLSDPPKPTLEPGEMAVFPYADEGTILLKMASKIRDERGQPFSLVIDPFSGDGKSGLPIVHANIATRISGSDINPRAVNLAKANADVNGLLERSTFALRNIITDGLPDSDFPGNTLYIANPPFALKARGASMDTMRDGGENGLELTMEFAERALHAAHSGDVIMGIGYSRIGNDGKVELEEELKKITQTLGGELSIELLEGQKQWRDFDGKKEQSNPMPITPETFALKANPNNSSEIAAFQAAAQFHNEAGYSHLGYYGYVIQNNPPNF